MSSEAAEPLLSKDGSIHVTDEFWSTLTSTSGAILGLIGSTWIVWEAIALQKFWHALGFAIYGIGLVKMFASSALHHGINSSPKVEHWLRQLDYFAIFILIAGTFTPFALVVLPKPAGPLLLGLIWLLAFSGIFLKARFPNFPRKGMTAFYVGMSWIGAFVILQVYQAVSWAGILGLIVGGFFFTVGALIYAFERPNPLPGKFGFHEIWHLCVLLGCAGHFHSVAYLLNV